MDIRELEDRFVVKRQIPRSTDPGDLFIPCRDGHLFGGAEGGLGVYLSFGTPRRKTARMKKAPFVVVRQDADAEVVGFVADADLELAFTTLRARRRNAVKSGTSGAKHDAEAEKRGD